MNDRFSTFSISERTIWMAVTLALAATVIMLAVLTVRMKTALDTYSDNVSSLLESVVNLDGRLKAYNEKASAIREGIEGEAGSRPVSREVREKVAADLLRRNDLIPYEGTLGGTMRFSQGTGVRVINDRWVMVSFEDGHVAGSMLLRYAFKSNGSIEWTVIDSRLE